MRAVEVRVQSGSFQFKYQYSFGDDHAITDWAQIAYRDVPANGILSLSGPSDNTQQIVVRLQNKVNTKEIYDIPIPTTDTTNGLNVTVSGSDKTLLDRPYFRVLYKTNTNRLKIELDHYDADGYAYLKETSGLTRGSEQWYWTVNNCPTKIADNGPMGLLKVPQGSYVYIHRDEVTTGTPRRNNEGYPDKFINNATAWVWTGFGAGYVDTGEIYPTFFRTNLVVETFQDTFPDETNLDGFINTHVIRQASAAVDSFIRVGITHFDVSGFPVTARSIISYNKLYFLPGGQGFVNYARSLGKTTDQLNRQECRNYADQIDTRFPKAIDQMDESGVGQSSPQYCWYWERVGEIYAARTKQTGIEYNAYGAYTGSSTPSPGGRKTFRNDNFFPHRREPLGTPWGNLALTSYYDGNNALLWCDYLSQQRYKYMDTNTGIYWAQPNNVDEYYTYKNGLLIYNKAKFLMANNIGNSQGLPEYPKNSRKNVCFVWDMCDNGRSCFTVEWQNDTTVPAGYVLSGQRYSPPPNAMVMIGLDAATLMDGFMCWNEGLQYATDQNFRHGNPVGGDPNNWELPAHFYPQFPGGVEDNSQFTYYNEGRLPTAANGPRGTVDFFQLGVWMGRNLIDRRLHFRNGGTYQFVPFSVNGVSYTAQPNGSDVLYGANDYRGTVMKFSASGVASKYVYFNPYGDNIRKTITVNDGSGVTMTGFDGNLMISR